MAYPLAAVKTRRTLLGITAVTIAKRLVMATTSYSRMERGERRCYLDKAVVIASMLGCSLDQLAIEPIGEEKAELFKLGERNREASAGHVTIETPEDIYDNEQEQLSDSTVPATGTVVNHTPSAPHTPAILAPELTDQEKEDALIAEWSMDEDDDN